MMARTKRIYILMIEVNKLFFFIFAAVFSKRNRKHVLSSCRNTHESLGELEKAVETPAARVPTAFLVLPNFHSCFYNSIETWHMFSIS